MKSTQFERTHNADLRPDLLIVPGTFVVGPMAHAYRRLGGRVLPMARGGLGHPEHTYKILREQVEEVNDGKEVPAVALGHSQGAVYVKKLAQEGLISHAILVAGPNISMDQDNFAAQAASKIIPRDEFRENLTALIDFIHTLRDEVKTEWSPGVNVDVVLPTYDQIVHHSHQLGLELAPGTGTVTEWIESPTSFIRGLKMARYIVPSLMGMPENVRPLHTMLASEHMSVIASDGLRWLANKRRDDIQRRAIEKLQSGFGRTPEEQARYDQLLKLMPD